MPAPKGNKFAAGHKGASGRPSTYRKEYAKRAFELALLGATDEQLGRIFGVTEATISKWRLDFQEFNEALKRGKDEADAKVSRSLYERAIGYSHKAIKFFQYQGVVIREDYIEHYPPEPVACFFWLKNRQPAKWRDKPVPDTDDRAVNDSLKALDEQAAQYYKKNGDNGSDGTG